MILTTVKIGEDPAPGPGHPHPTVVVAVVITTNPAGVDAHHHTLDHPRLLPGEGPPHTALRGNVVGTDAAPQAPPAPPGPPPAPRPRLDQNHILQHQPHDITKVTHEEIILSQSLPTEVTDAVVEETGIDDHLLTRVEHMLMRTRPDVREATPAAAAAAEAVHLAGPITAAGAETGAGPATIGRGAASGVGSTRIEGKDLVVEIRIGTISSVTSRSLLGIKTCRSA